MTKSNFSSKRLLPREELRNSANSLSDSNDMHALNRRFYPKYEAGFQRGNKNHPGALQQILRTGTCLFISKARGLQGSGHAAETVLVWSEARRVRCMLGGKRPPTTCQMLEKSRCRRLAGSQRTPGGFVLSAPKVKLVKQIKCLINFGILELVWQEGKNTYCKERNNNTCQRGSILASQCCTQIISLYK